MTRVASFSQSQALLQGILRNQADLFTAQRQVNTGKKTDEFRGLASQVSTLVGAKALQARTESYVTTSEAIDRVVSSYDVQLTNLVETARDMRQTMLETVGQNEAQGFSLLLEEKFNLMVSTLNTKIGDSFVFGGSNTDQPPVNISTTAELIGLAAASDAFDNDQIKAKVRIADNIEFEYGVLADEVADDIFASMKRIAEFNAGPSGPLSGELTAAQRSFLEGELSLLDSAIAGAQDILISNGLRAKRLEDVSQGHKDQLVFLETFVADIEDVDIAEAITRLNNERTALEASYRVVGDITRLSIVNFI